jgi:DNA (cytosine-5)-methyltransferase 1
MQQDINTILENILIDATKLLDENTDIVEINSLKKEEIEKLNLIIFTAESRKAILTVLITLLFYKVINPKQDIRSHQVSLENGFSGRTFDTQIITPFMKRHNFPAMAESGWHTLIGTK